MKLVGDRLPGYLGKLRDIDYVEVRYLYPEDFPWIALYKELSPLVHVGNWGSVPVHRKIYAYLIALHRATNSQYRPITSVNIQIYLAYAYPPYMRSQAVRRRIDPFIARTREDRE